MTLGSFFQTTNNMFAKVAIFFATLVAVNAMALHHGVALAHTGVSASSRHQDAHGNYAFGYDIVDGKGASNSRSEVGDGHGNVKGSYTLNDIDGRARKVDYVADGHGFRAVVKTNEKGTAHSAPAAALIASPYAGPVAPVVAHAAPVLAHAAPIAHVATISHVAPVAHAATISHVSHAAPLVHGAVLNAGHLGVGNLGYGYGQAGLIGYGGLGHAGVIGLGGLGHAGLIGHGGLLH